MPKAMRARAEKTAPKVLAIADAALAEGTSDACQAALEQMEEIGRQTFGGQSVEGFQTDHEDILRRQITQGLEEGEDADAIIERISSEILKRVENKVQLIANKVFTEMAAKFASAGIDMGDAVVHALDNTAIYNEVDKEIYNQILNTKDELTGLIAEAAPVVPESQQAAFEKVSDEVLRYNWSEEASAELKDGLDSFATFVAVNSDSKAVAIQLEVLLDQVEKLQASDIAAQYGAGLIPFTDVADPSQFFSDDMVALKDAGIFQGYEGLVQPARDVNLVEAGATLVRAFDEQLEGSAPTLVKAAYPEWASDEVAVLAANGVDAVQTPGNLADEATRGEFFHMAVEILEAAGVDVPDVSCESVAGDLSDLSCSHPYADDVAALHEMGIVQGVLTPDGDREAQLDNTVKRAEIATIINEMLHNGAVEQVTAPQ